MKKTVSINLNGVAFTIDEDAYATLKSYLSDLEKHFPNSDEREILKDIEARIAELFTEKLVNGKTVIENPDVISVVETLGGADQFDEEEQGNDKETEKKAKRKHRKLYRNPNDAILGGVASGCAAYLGWDTLLVRILFVVVVVFGFGWFIPIYLVMWALVPEAHTAAQRLEMQGIEPNFENIKKFVESDRFKETATRIGSRLGEVFIWCFKVVFVFIGGIFCFVFLSVAVAVMFALVALLVNAELIMPYFSEFAVTTPLAIAFLVAVAALFICPVVEIIAVFGRLLNRNKQQPRHRWLSWSLFFVWLIALFTVVLIPLNALGLKESKNLLFEHSDLFEKNIDVTEFSAIELNGVIDAQLIQSPTTEVSLRFPESLTDKVVAKVENGTLKISMDHSKLSKWKGITAYISSPNIESIKLRGVANLESQTVISGDKLNVEVEGISSVDCDIDVKNLRLAVEGTSEVELNGKAQNAKIQLEGKSSLDAFDCVFRNCRANLSGINEADIFVTDSLWATADGLSEIEYKGNPIFVSENALSKWSEITKRR